MIGILFDLGISLAIAHYIRKTGWRVGVSPKVGRLAHVIVFVFAWRCRLFCSDRIDAFGQCFFSIVIDLADIQICRSLSAVFSLQVKKKNSKLAGVLAKNSGLACQQNSQQSKNDRDYRRPSHSFNPLESLLVSVKKCRSKLLLRPAL